MKMVYKNMSKIAKVISGQSPPSKYYNDKGKGLPFFQGKTDFGTTYPIPRTWCTNPKKIAEPNDILMSVRAPVGPVNLADTKACIGRGLCALRANKDCYFLYLYYFLKNNQELIAQHATGAVFKAITNKNIQDLKIFIPENLNDQKRIAKVLTDCEDLIAERKESIRLSEELLRSTFLDMFGDPRTNERNWEIYKISEYTSSIVPGRTKPKSFTGNIPWVTTKDLVDLGFTEKSDLGLSLSEISTVRAKIIPKNSVLITCVGDLGISSIANIDMVINQQLHSYQCDAEINNVFLMFYLSFQKQYMYKVASTTTVPYMNKTTCNSIPLIKPPIDLQEKFANIVTQVEAVKKDYEASLRELEQLYKSLSQRAFEGNLDVSKVNLSYDENEAITEDDIVGEKDTDYLDSSDKSKYYEALRNMYTLDADGKLDITHMSLLDYMEAVHEFEHRFDIYDAGQLELRYLDSHPEIFFQFLIKDYHNRVFTVDDIGGIIQNMQSAFGSKDYDEKTYNKLKQFIFEAMQGDKPMYEQFFDKTAKDEANRTIKLKLTDEAFKAENK